MSKILGETLVTIAGIDCLVRLEEQTNRRGVRVCGYVQPLNAKVQSLNKRLERIKEGYFTRQKHSFNDNTHQKKSESFSPSSNANVSGDSRVGYLSTIVKDSNDDRKGLCKNCEHSKEKHTWYDDGKGFLANCQDCNSCEKFEEVKEK